MFEQLFGSKTRFKLLKLFLSHPEEYFYIREITRKIGERVNSVRRELENLEKLNIVIRNLVKSGKALQYKTKSKRAKKYYRANPNFILYEELKNLILKSRLLLEKSLAQKIKESGKIKLLILTGIFANNLESKTDILIVGSVNRRKLRSLIRKLERNFEQEINYTVMSTKEFKYRHDVTDKFLYNILEGKKMTLIDKLLQK